ncbi:glycosyltransferase [Natronococcus sp. A-GB1]|uniref:glycosyltransferase n=1 Tax=Natronococcus sp. A-GB1 TaxID=3037648 RepID=UPI00241F4C01|nr:glycosyltransferase [Natronococcus sp. A-GB1]MDG5761754.1 glycosyltransferase [Natronococcus sp. A-GB1]
MSDDCLVSVIVPVYNDPDGIETTLSSLRDQTLSTDAFEIIVVDNASSDATRAVARDRLAEVDNGYVVDEREVQSSYAARNTGIERSSGEILAFLDADMSVPTTWLAELVATFERTGAEYLGCRVRLYCPCSEPTLVAKYDRAFGFPVEFYLDTQNFAPTCCLAVTRALVADVGPFDPRLTSSGDLEFGQRVARAGYDQHFASDLVVYHPTRTTLADYTKKRLRVGAGQEQLARLPGAAADSRPWYHPKNVLPPHPGNFRRRLSRPVSGQTLALFYLLSYVGKLSLFAGRLRWKLKGR